MAKNRAIPAPTFNRQPRDVSRIFRKTSVPSVPADVQASADTQEEVQRFCDMLTGIILTIPFFKHDERARIPAYGREGDACLDLYACIGQEIHIMPGQRTIIPTGIGVALPKSFELQVRARSGNAAKLGLMVMNSPGTIDYNYRGVIGVILYNTTDSPVVIRHNDAIAQGKISWAPEVKAVVIKKEDATETNRGEQGYGSSGLVGGKP